jgi:predicted restriction endonuclease
MPFNPLVKFKILRDSKTKELLPCVMCGTIYPLPEAAHIIDEEEWKQAKGHDSQIKGIPLCPNCHRIFDEILRPRLYKALKQFGTDGLPKGWISSNKQP